MLESQQWRIKLWHQIQTGKFVGLKGSLEDENLHVPFSNQSLKVFKFSFSYYFLFLSPSSFLSFFFFLVSCLSLSLSFCLSPSNPKCWQLWGVLGRISQFFARNVSYSLQHSIIKCLAKVSMFFVFLLFKIHYQ